MREESRPAAGKRRDTHANTYSHTVLNSIVSADLNEQEKAFLVSLSSLPGIGSKRLWELLMDMEPHEAWNLLGRKDHPQDKPGKWERYVSETNPLALYERHLRAGIGITVYGDPLYPKSLLMDPEPPLVLFSRGDIAVMDKFPKVAVVGTRSATPYGIEIATQMGYELSLHGVAVVSGLAIGIDTACHLGVIDACTVGGAPPVGIAAGGLDKVYPSKQLRLWNKVIDSGVILTERPLGVAPIRRLFPVRNRIIAALARVIVVVESHRSGGSLHTVEAGISRGNTILAVPGSVRSPSSEGSNALIFDGCGVARDAADVLVALSLESEGVEINKGLRKNDYDLANSTANSAAHPSEPSDLHRSNQDVLGCSTHLNPMQQSVLEAVGWEPTGMETLLKRTNLPMGKVALCLVFLTRGGWITAGNGWWMRKTADSRTLSKPGRVAHVPQVYQS